MELFAITDNTVGTRIVRIVTDRPTTKCSHTVIQ